MKSNGSPPFSRQRIWRLNPIVRSLSTLLLLAANNVSAREYAFSPGALEGETLQQQEIDLSLFSNPSAQLPGVYASRIMLNDTQQEDETLTYVSGKDGVLQAQLTPALLRKWSVNVDKFPALAALPENTVLAQPLSAYIPFAAATLDFSTMTLRISMPQGAIAAQSKGYIDPSRWDDGVPVGFADYAFSGTQSSDDDTSSNQYLNLRTGINIGGWRARNYSTWSKTDSSHSWEAINTYIQHDIDVLKAQFTAGENSTRGEVFDSLQYRGVNVASDESMLPYSQRGFAPTIRGIASSNAEVSVRQNGYLIYRQTVAPGAFEINDLYSTTNSGDLEVTVKEADGTEHRFTQPYSSVAVMLRPGSMKYEVTAGRYRASGDGEENEPLFAQGSLIYGVTNLLTLFGGLTASADYQALNAGAGIALGRLGALSMDVTAARTQLDNGKQSTGQSYRLLYSGKIDATDTNFTLASYRYSTRGYYSFADANQRYDEHRDDWLFRYNKRNRLQASISQTVLGSSLYLSGYQQDYWDTAAKERSVTVGLSHVFNYASVHLNWTYSKTNGEESDRMVSLGVSVPLSQWLPRAWANYSLSNSKHGDTSQNIGINGTLLDDERLNYAFQQSHTKHGGGDSSSVYGSYRSQYANFDASYSSSSATNQLSYGMSGAVVAHPHGVTLAQPLGSEFAIVNTQGAAGVRFLNQRGIQTDWLGNAVIPSLSAYQENGIRIDTTTLPDDVDTDQTAATVIPSRNAAVAAQFNAHIGYRMLIRLMRSNGSTVPFGAVATVESPALSGIVDDTGTLYLAGVPDGIQVKVKWGNTAASQCIANINPTASAQPSNAAGIRHAEALCQQE